MQTGPRKSPLQISRLGQKGFRYTWMGWHEQSYPAMLMGYKVTASNGCSEQPLHDV